MDDKSVIKLFKEQLNNEIKTIVDELGLENEGQGFSWWYLNKLAGLSDEEIEEFYCDGSGDLGIDAIFKDRNETVHFYQFKNSKNEEKGFPTGDVDKTLSGLRLVLSRKYESIANKLLKELLDEVLKTIPNGYQLHFVSSGNGLEQEAIIKLKDFIKGLGMPDDYFIYSDENIKVLSDKFYNKTLPTLNKEIIINIPNLQPYMLKLADHENYLFHLKAKELANLYEIHGEMLLQQNIRMFEGENPTNESILKSCTGEDSNNFYHYNNGITILCDEAKWDLFTQSLAIERPQIVNGGQTVRILHKAMELGELKDDVFVVVRTIASQGNKQFASNVAVNLNNQTKVESSFLKSNDPRIVQLAASLKAIGWYLERREGEINEISRKERIKIEKAISGSLDEKKIPLKEGTQAYAATFYENAPLARQSPGKMFVSVTDKGHFEKIFCSKLTAEDFSKAYELYTLISKKVNAFKKIKRNKRNNPSWESDYAELFGKELIKNNVENVEQIVPQSIVFLTGFSYQYFIKNRNLKWEEMLKEIKEKPSKLGYLLKIMIECKKNGGDEVDKTWITLSKNQTFYNVVANKLLTI